jgi:hypothetical protein
MNMKEICKNCGASKGLRNWKTMQCPLGGREQPVGKPDLWTGETYLEQNDDIDILFARVAELEEQVKRLLEAVPQAGQVAKCPPHMRVKIHTKLFAWQTHDMPAENIQKAECLDCGEWFEVEDIDETAEVRE